MHAIVDGLGFILPYRKTSKTAPFYGAVSYYFSASRRSASR